MHINAGRGATKAGGISEPGNVVPPVSSQRAARRRIVRVNTTAGQADFGANEGRPTGRQVITGHRPTTPQHLCQPLAPQPLVPQASTANDMPPSLVSSHPLDGVCASSSSCNSSDVEADRSVPQQVVKGVQGRTAPLQVHAASAAVRVTGMRTGAALGQAGLKAQDAAAPGQAGLQAQGAGAAAQGRVASGAAGTAGGAGARTRQPTQQRRTKAVRVSRDARTGSPPVTQGEHFLAPSVSADPSTQQGLWRHAELQGTARWTQHASQHAQHGSQHAQRGDTQRPSPGTRSGGVASAAPCGLSWHCSPWPQPACGCCRWRRSFWAASHTLDLGLHQLADLGPHHPLLVGWYHRVRAGHGQGARGAGRVELWLQAGARAWGPGASVRVLAVVPHGASSPYKTTWEEVMPHVGQRLAWTDSTFQLILFSEQELEQTGTIGTSAWDAFTALTSQGCQVLLGASVSSPSVTARFSSLAEAGLLPPVRVFLGTPDRPSPPDLLKATSLQGYAAQGPSLVDQVVSRLLPWTAPAKGAVLWSTVQDLWARHTSDDLLFVLLVLINQYVTPVKEVAMTTKGFDLPSLQCMVMNCGSQIVGCVTNPVCKAGLDCLQGCSFNDQVCQYRCIVSHESPQFEAFALCILQKHNCRALDAKPPMMPDPAPMATFRGAPLTHEAAEGMLLGWMTPEPGVVSAEQVLPFSWLVAAGKNPAYDYFPCQHQLFTRGKGKGVLWYEPVFKAIKLDGSQVWRRRRYRVKRGVKPGTFQFTVLDNGVTSNEFWRVLDCDEAYEWCLFYYSGAAAAAGLSYSGAVLGSRDGAMPTSPAATIRLEAALKSAGIQPWELSFVDNTACAGAPLDLAPA